MPKTQSRKSFCTSLLLASLIVPATACANRWQPATPIVHVAEAPVDPSWRVEDVLARARAAGYVAEQVDAERGYLRFRAKLGDGGMDMHGVVVGANGSPASYGFMSGTSTQCWFAVQVDPRGSLELTASGYHVKDHKGKMHRKLRAEMRSFAELIGA